MTQRRKGEKSDPELPEHQRLALAQLLRLALDQKRYPGTDRGPEALYWFLKVFPPPVALDISLKSRWQTALEWLDASQALPEVTDLRHAIDNLGRGVVHPVLEKPKGAGQGRRKSSSDVNLGYLRIALEAVKQIEALYADNPTLRDEMIENEAGVPLKALERWKQMIDDAPRRFRPRLAWYIYYGNEDPIEVLKRAAEAYRQEE